MSRQHGTGANGQGARSAGGGDIGHAAIRGAIGAMAMTGMRTFTVDMGLIKRTPPQAIARQRARGLMRRIPRRRRRAAVEILHWGYGTIGGATFGALPDGLRRQPWAGPAYGLLVWFGFEAGLAPVLGLSEAKSGRLVERATLAVDHLLYGLVLSEMRRRPQE